VLGAAWDASDGIQHPSSRARVQLRILLALPDEVRPRFRGAVLASALETDSDTGSWDGQNVLAELAAELSPDEITKAFRAFLEYPDAWDGNAGLRLVLPYLSDAQVEVAFEQALNEEDVIARRGRFEVLGPRLSEDRLVEACNLALAAEHDYELRPGVLSVAPFLAPSLLVEMVDAVTASLGRVQTGAFIDMASQADEVLLARLSTTVDLLEDPSLRKEAAEVIARRELSLAPSREVIARYLPAAAARWPGFDLGAVLATLPDEQVAVVAELMTVAGPFPPQFIAMVLGAIFPRLADAERPAAATALLSAALGTLDEYALYGYGAIWLEMVLPYLSSASVGLARDLAARLRPQTSWAGEPHEWLAARIILLALEPEDELGRAAAEVAGLVRESLSSPSQRASGLVEIVRRLPLHNRDIYVTEILALARSVQDLRCRVGLLTGLLAVLTPAEQQQIVDQVAGIAGAGVAGVREIFAERVRRLLEDLPAAAARQVLTAVVTNIGQRAASTPEDPGDAFTPAGLHLRPLDNPADTMRRIVEWLPAGDAVRETTLEPGVPIGSGMGPEFVPPSSTPPAPSPGGGEPPTRLVNTGFAADTAPTAPIAADRPLLTGSRWVFWLEIGPPIAGAIDTDRVPLPSLPATAELDVVVSGFPGEIEVTPGHDLGTLFLKADGSVSVRAQPGLGGGVDPDAATRRLFFPVRTPERPGPARLRCGIYHEQVLLQSRIVEAFVSDSPGHHPGALRTTVDFTLTHALDPSTLPRRQTYVGSLMLDDEDGTHALRVMASDGQERYAQSLTIDSEQLVEQMSMARATLRRVAWGSADRWQPGVEYRYSAGTSAPDLAADLIRLAATGYRLHHLLLRAAARSVDGDTYAAADRLTAALRRPGLVQLALKESAQHVIPAALLYDHPLDTGADLTICRAFLEALHHHVPLESTPCFVGACPHVGGDEATVVCPSGFWGYRHALGLPVSIGSSPDTAEEMRLSGLLRMAVGVYSGFAGVEAHCEAVRALWPGADWCLTTDRATTLRELRTRQPELVYFYCHGGVSKSVPYLRVGSGMSSPVITPDNLFENRVRWADSRPLVFLNGCRTTELDPEQAIDFVSFFVEDAWARGVIGTEITVFEDLARPFAEECLRRFLVARQPVGEAVRGARLELLQRGNPLGLAYIPFVLPTVRLVDGESGRS